MSKIALGIVAAVVAVSSFAAPAAAQNYGRGAYSPYDFNRDGRVDARENRQARIDQSRGGYGGYRGRHGGYGEYSPYDFNRDGRVDARENRQAQIDQGYGDYYGYRQYSPYDLNRDGRVTRREMRLAQQRRPYR